MHDTTGRDLGEEATLRHVAGSLVPYEDRACLSRVGVKLVDMLENEAPIAATFSSRQVDKRLSLCCPRRQCF
eukprot:2415612-Pleurochrysis_carterae.AAC.1